jgi:hypothetical protein
VDARSVFIVHPWLALLPSIVFTVAGYWRRRAIAWLAAAVWLLYALYENAIARRILCSGECNIRVDLLLLYPVLLVLSITAAVMIGRGGARAIR